jgi:hypothetical protein
LLRKASALSGRVALADAPPQNAAPQNEELAAFDASGLNGAPADQYRLSYVGRDGAQFGDVQKFDAAMRTAFAAANVPPAQAQGLLDSFLDGADRFIELKDDVSRGIYKAEQHAILSRFGDPEKIVLLASLPLGRMPKPTQAMLFERGGHHSATTIVRLAQVGQLILHREQLAARGGAK